LKKILRLTVEYENGSQREAWSADLVQPAEAKDSILLMIRSFFIQKTENILAYALVVVPAFLCRGPGADCFFDADRSLRPKVEEGEWLSRLDNR